MEMGLWAKLRQTSTCQEMERPIKPLQKYKDMRWIMVKAIGTTIFQAYVS